MEQTQKCPECGTALPPEAPGGHCLRCAFKLGLQTTQACTSQTNSPVPLATIQVALVASEQAGDTVGRYKLLEKIGEGGFGAVYVAEQREPVKRRVALKIIKLGMDTREVVARFEAERQALAMMDHPNIAKVLDAGALDNGRPYFVMELVRGIKITEYCDQNKLSTPERLSLFIKICQAVQHAHQKGIIHRDIKPSNILVTLHDGVPVPKVIDFGIAKATQGELTDKTVYTQFQQFIGTPAYMSPEQAEMSGLDIDTRSDIYSLGVLLYELLTGKTPFEQRDLLKAGLDEMRRIIREQEPPRPSTRLSTMVAEDLTTAASRRQSDAPKLVNLVQGDLDWIVMKCLEKDRTRRYETANGLANDLKRHLENETVTARPPSAVYRFQKAWGRNKTAFAAATAIAIVLVAATTVSLWQAVRARRAERLANERLVESEAISKFLTQVFQSPDPGQDGRTVTVAESLNKAARKLETDLASQPARRITLMETLAGTYDALGLYHDAIPLEEKVRDYYIAASGIENSNTLAAMENLAVYYGEDGRREETVKLMERVVPAEQRINGPTAPDTLDAISRLAESYNQAGRSEEGIKLLEKALMLSRKANEPANTNNIHLMTQLSAAYFNAGRDNEALKLGEEAVAFAKTLGADSPETIWPMDCLAYSYDRMGRRDEAIQLSEAALALRSKINGREHPDTIWAIYHLANSYGGDARLSKAQELYEEVLTLSRKVLGAEHPRTLKAICDLARIYYQAGRRGEAFKLREEALALSRKINGPEHPETLQKTLDLALSCSDAGHPEEALQLREEALRISRKVNGLGHPETSRAMIELADSYGDAGRIPEARNLDKEALALLSKTLGPKNQNTWRAMRCLASLDFESGRQHEAITLQAEATEYDAHAPVPLLELATWELWTGGNSDYEATCRRMMENAGEMDVLAMACASKACCLRPSTNAVLLAKALDMSRRAVESGRNSRVSPWYQFGLGLSEYRNARYADAEKSLLLAEKTADQVANANERTDIVATARLFRAMSAFRQNRTSEAEKLFDEAQATMPPFPKDETRPYAPGKPFDQNLLIWWLACKEAKSALNESSTTKQ